VRVHPFDRQFIAPRLPIITPPCAPLLCGHFTGLLRSGHPHAAERPPHGASPGSCSANKARTESRCPTPMGWFPGAG
jgi:hypothetical protein